MNNSHSRRRLSPACLNLAFVMAVGLMVQSGKAITIPEAVDATNLVWTTGGSSGAVPWAGQATTTHDGVDAAQSGAIGNSKTTYVQTTIVGPGKLSFWWKVSSEDYLIPNIWYDFLGFSINGNLLSRIGGTIGWQQRIYFLPAGTNTVRWSYVKDGSDPFIFPWDDKAWLDQVVFVPTVTTTNDGGPFSLRQVIADAPPGSTILFDASLSGQTITLTNGQLLLDKNLTIDASALPGGIAIDGNATSRIFGVASNCTVVLKSLTLTNGYASGSTPYVPDSWGGGIYNQGTLTLNACTLAGNSAAFGGGILNEYNGSTLTVVESTLSGNSAIISGGGIYNGATLTVNQSTLVGNSGSFVGGIYSDSLSAVNQSTLTGNSATNAGAGSSAGGIYNNSGTCTLSNTIVAGNSAPANPELFVYAGVITTLGNNLTNGVPLLASLGDYGGSTPTMPPLPGSPAIDGCTNGSSFITDQRGLPRIVGPYADLGAVEFQDASPIITTSADSGTGSLRFAATYTTNGSTLTFATNLAGATILLTSGQVLLDKNLAIDASALPGGIALDGNTNSRIFLVASNTTVFLNSLTITNGHAVDSYLGNYGGGIYTAGTLTMNQCTLAGNLADNNGGGIFIHYGTLTMNQCTLASNSGNYGGGIHNFQGAVAMNQCTVTNNSANHGGGIWNSGTLTVNESSFIGNYVTIYGGGLYHGSGLCTLNQSTFFGNAADSGDGAIGSYGTLVVNQCTLSGNSASSGGGGGILSGGALTLSNSIVAGNSPDNIYTNISGTLTATGVNLTNGVPLLAPLGDYGGPTPTLPPLAGSPAIDGCTNGCGFTTDQRGFPRIAGPFADIGAVEAYYGKVVTTTADDGAGSLRSAIADVPNYIEVTVTFAPELSGATILLTSGELLLNKNLTIDASALPGGLTINGNTNGRVFQVSTGTTNVLTALTLTNGYAGGASYPTSVGGGILNLGHLTLNRCTLAGNSALEYGGGIYNDSGTVTLNATTLSSNSVFYFFGGGIYNKFYGTVTLNASTLEGNSATLGGGICSYTPPPIVTPITSSTILNQCTLTGNNASSGGGAVCNLSGWTFMTNCTVTGNTSPSGAGVDATGFSYTATETVVANCIIAGNTGGNDLDLDYSLNSSAFLSIGGNLIGSGEVSNFTASGDMTNQTAATIKLAPLGNYGGPTPTMPPLTGSPAIDGCINGTSFTTDQRGLPRIIGPFADIGAVEAAAHPIITSLADFGLGSLRYAVDYTTNGSLLTFDTALSGQTILLTSGQLLVNKNLTIDASALPAGIALNGNHASRIFEVAAGANVMLDSLTLTNGKSANGAVGATGSDGGGSNPGGLGGTGGPGASGGGIHNEGTLTLNRVTMAGNSAGNGGNGGAGGPGIIQGTGGTGGPGGDGGAINNASTGTLNILNSTIANNASGSGANGGSGASQGDGGSGGSGGGIANAGILRLTHATVTGNAAGIRGNLGSGSPSHGNGGGIQTSGTLNPTNTIVALNTAPGVGPDLSGSANSIGGVNFIGNPSGATGLGVAGINYLTGDPMLDPLGNYGGPTQTRPPLTNSPVVDATPFGLATDQRGLTRPQGANYDIGAVELVQIIVANNPPVLTGLTILGNGTFQFGFANLTGASFTVFASTNVAWPLNSWSNLGPAVETPPASGQFQFIDPQATNYTERFYRVTSP